MKQCKICHEQKPASEFYSAYLSCKECVKKRSKANRDLNPDALRHWRWRKNFGISPEEYADILLAQGGVCAICGNPEQAVIRGRLILLAVDHDHNTGEIRGLLCSKCNRGLGHFNDSPDLLERALRYLNG